MSLLRALLLTDPLIVLVTALMGTLSLAASLFDRHGATQHHIARRWARMLLRIAGVKAEVSGRERLDPQASYVIASNHTSFMDIPLLVAHLPLQFRFFAKKSLFRIPFIGTHLRRAGHLPVERENPRAQLKTLSEGARAIRERGVSVLIFPEGGRAPELREFKEGAAYVAIKSGIPVVPVGIVGMRQVLPMGSLVVRPGRVALRVGHPIPTVPRQDRLELTDRIREQVARLIAKPAKIE